MSEQRLVDANALRADFVDRYHKAEDWIIKAEDIFIKTRAEATRDFIGEVIMTIDNAPTVKHSLLPLSGEADNAYMRGYEVGKAEGIMKASTRPKGEWIDYDNTFYKCPDCGYLLEKCCPQCQNKVILPKGGAE